MNHKTTLLLAPCLFLAASGAMLADTTQERLHESSSVLREILSAPDNGIPLDLLTESHCVVVVPAMKKAAFLVGGKYGRGFVTCRSPSGPGWGAPAAIRVEGGSFGFQIGASETDLVLLVMNRRGMERLAQSKFTLGGEAEVAAGPVGRHADAQTDARMTAKILSYSRSRGAFAGISLQGATLRQDLDVNRELYARSLTNRQILMKNLHVPAAASELLGVLNRYSSMESNP
jgi:lipid-binding SYLF domain-containing protein